MDVEGCIIFSNTSNLYPPIPTPPDVVASFALAAPTVFLIGNSVGEADWMPSTVHQLSSRSGAPLIWRRSDMSSEMPESKDANRLNKPGTDLIPLNDVQKRRLLSRILA